MLRQPLGETAHTRRRPGRLGHQHPRNRAHVEGKRRLRRGQQFRAHWRGCARRCRPSGILPWPSRRRSASASNRCRSPSRHGYDVRALADQSNAKPVEIKAFLAGTLHPDRTGELTEFMKTAGTPV
jgi:hypothetical protein